MRDVGKPLLLALLKDRAATKNRGKNITQPLLKRQNAARLKQIEAQFAQVEQAITDQIVMDESLKARFDIPASNSVLSKITAFTLFIEMPELGELDEKAVGELSGLAPNDRQSGRWPDAPSSLAQGRSFGRHDTCPPSSPSASIPISRPNTTRSKRRASHREHH